MTVHVSAPAPLVRPGAWPNGAKSVDNEQRTGPGEKGCYRTKAGAAAYYRRVSARMCPRPPCQCGCGTPVDWQRGKGQWYRYASGHYRPSRPFHDEAWLRQQYTVRGRTTDEIAADCGVVRSAVRHQMVRFGIPRRGRSESRIGRMVGAKNPAWRGGVADWDYAAGWKVIARRIRDRDEWTCQDCAEQRKRWGHSLHVHHIDEDKLNNDPENLISLCAGCHRQRHREGVRI